MYPQYPYDPNQYIPPFYQTYPMIPMPPKPSLLQSMKYSLNQVTFSSTIRTAQKTLYTVNQIIPIVNQLRPILHNASTAFKVVKAVKQFDFNEIDDEIDQNIHTQNQVFENMTKQ